MKTMFGRSGASAAVAGSAEKGIAKSASRYCSRIREPPPKAEGKGLGRPLVMLKAPAVDRSKVIELLMPKEAGDSIHRWDYFMEALNDIWRELGGRVRRFVGSRVA